MFFSIADILKITKYTKRLIVGFDEDNIPIYNNNIQRNVENSRIEKIADFLISDPQAIFPTNIVLGIPSSMIESQTIENEQIQLTIDSKVFDELLKPDGDVYVTIIDGQHRIRGIEIAIDRLVFLPPFYPMYLHVCSPKIPLVSQHLHTL